MIAVELKRQFRRVRTYLGLGLIALVPIAITLAFKFGNPGHRRRDQGLIAVARSSGLNMAIGSLLTTTGFLLVVVVTLFAADAVAGEASWGTLRYLLIRPVRRARLLTAKLVASAALALLTTVVVVVVGLVAGLAAFGWHPATIISPRALSTPSTSTSPGVAVPNLPSLPVSSMPPTTALWHLLVAMVFIAWSMAGVFAFTFLVSTLTTKSFGAIAAGVGLMIVSFIFDNISVIGAVRDYLPTHYWSAWENLFVTGGSLGSMWLGVLSAAAYAAVFLAVAWWHFTRKDILT